MRARSDGSLTPGSVYAVVSAIACLQPSATFLIFYVIPAPAWLCVGGLFAWELWSASFPRPHQQTDAVGHVGGLVAGFLFARFGLH